MSSDIDMMNGNFGPIVLKCKGMKDQAVEVGNEVTDVRVGDIVAARGEPAYADYYNAKPMNMQQCRSRSNTLQSRGLWY